MRKLIAWLLIFLTLGTALLSVHVGVRAQEDDANDDGEDAEPTHQQPPQAAADEDEEADATTPEADEDKDLQLIPSPDVVTSILFPDYQDKRFPIGEKVTVLVNFKNTGKSGFNVSYIGAHLHSPFDLSYYIQNFTVREVAASVEPNHEISLEYVFMPDKSLEPLEFHLSAWVLYNNTANDMFLTTFQNSTIELIEKSSEFDVKQFFSYVLGAGVFGLVGYIFLSLSGSLNKTSSSSSAERRSASSSSNAASSGSSSGSTSGSALEDWAGPLYKPAAKSKAIGRSSSAKKKSSAPASPKAASS